MHVLPYNKHNIFCIHDFCTDLFIFHSNIFPLAESSGPPDTIEQWIQLVHEKNALVSEESDLMVA